MEIERWWEVKFPSLLTVKNVTVKINNAEDQYQHYKVYTVGKSCKVCLIDLLERLDFDKKKDFATKLQTFGGIQPSPPK